MKTKLQIKSIIGSVLFEHECSTVKECLLEAIKVNTYLSGAYLRGAYLRGAYLSGANLSGAYLPIYSRWSVCIVNDKVKIGCKTKSIQEWDEWFAGSDAFETHLRRREIRKHSKGLRQTIKP